MTGSRPVLFVIGGSRGIGAEVVKRAVSDGYSVLFGYYKSRHEAEILQNELADEPGLISSLPVDVRNEQSIINFFEKGISLCGPPKDLVYAAGISGQKSKLQDLDLDLIHDILNTNLVGAIVTLKIALTAMSTSNEQSHKSIVLISSEAAKFGGRNIATYAASKAGLNALVRGLARELGESNIRINAVSPALIDTSMNTNRNSSETADVMEALPLNRLGKASEVANLVVWLLSDQASYISGSVYTVSGGR